MTARIDDFSQLCKQFDSELLQNEDEQLLMLPFSKGALSFSFIVPMQNDSREYDLLIERDGQTLFEDSGDLPRLADETDEELEQMFRSELCSSIKELMTMDFTISNDEIIFL